MRSLFRRSPRRLPRRFISITPFDRLKSPLRTHLCKDLLSQSPVASGPNNSVILCGWLQSSRAIGGLFFGVLRDWSGVVQFTWSREDSDKNGQLQAFENAVNSSLEVPVYVRGTLQPRPSSMVNPQQRNGALELKVLEFHVLNSAPADRPLELVAGVANQKEDTRLRWRWLEMREVEDISGNTAQGQLTQPPLQTTLRLRSTMAHATRNFLHDLGFVEVETPVLFKSTPEGASEFIVPTRHRSMFYSLPQSPQQYKQILMAGGLDKYFQIAKCFRDEDLRANRQPEFTQIDIEQSFVRQVDIMAMTERLVQHIAASIGLSIAPSAEKNSVDSLTFPQLAYFEAMERFGVDKPDTRFGFEIQDITQEIRASPLGLPNWFTEYAQKGYIKAINVKGGAALSRTFIDKLQAKTRQLSKQSLVILKTGQSKNGTKGWKGLGTSFEDPATHSLRETLAKRLDFSEQDLLIIFPHLDWTQCCSVLGATRLTITEELNAKGVLKLESQRFNFLWVTDFPLFEVTRVMASSQDQAGKLAVQVSSTHHPFTAAHPKDADKLWKLLADIASPQQLITTPTHHVDTSEPVAASPGKAIVWVTPEQLVALRSIRAQHYDIVANGVELGGGSVRIHVESQQRQVLSLFGASTESFSHLLDALRYGAPPHAGIALGLDRLVSLFASRSSESLPIRNVIAFPKTTSGSDLLVGSPTEVPPETLRNYHIQILPDDRKK